MCIITITQYARNGILGYRWAMVPGVIEILLWRRDFHIPKVRENEFSATEGMAFGFGGISKTCFVSGMSFVHWQ